jgi:hypothetical protein
MRKAAALWLEEQMRRGKVGRRTKQSKRYEKEGLV